MGLPEPAVQVVETGRGVYRVQVGEGRSATTHRVEVPAAYPAALGLGEVPVDELVAASFAFLLEREPSSSILRRFRLDQIARYFPEYPAEIARYLG